MYNSFNQNLSINKHEYPLLVLQSLQPVMRAFRKQIRDNGNLFNVLPSITSLFMFKSSKNDAHYFRVIDYKIEEDKDEVVYLFAMSPINERGEHVEDEFTDAKGLVTGFERWNDVLKAYESINLDEVDELTHQYEQEFYDEFEFVDDPNDPIGFNPEQLDFLYNFLTTLENDLKSTEFKDETISIVADTLELRDNIQGMTKKQFAKQFTMLLAKIKKVGMKLLYDTFDVAKKELIKKALYGGFSKLGEAGDHILNNIN